jgi:hypothetical protein
MTNPEINLIQKLSEVRQALEPERKALLTRVAAIEQALAVGMVLASPKGNKPTPKPSKVQRPGGIREAIMATVVGTPGMTIRQIQESLPDHPPKSIESVTHTMATAGILAKEGSSPKRFRLAPVATAAE